MYTHYSINIKILKTNQVEHKGSMIINGNGKKQTVYCHSDDYMTRTEHSQTVYSTAIRIQLNM